jgi:predicted nucleotidyltransferase
MKTLEQTNVLAPEDQAILLEVKRIIGTVLPGADVCIYGSVARGTKGPDSDYDVLVLTGEPVDWRTQEAVMDALYDLQLEKEILICTIFHTHSYWNSPLAQIGPFHTEVERDGIIL